MEILSKIKARTLLNKKFETSFIIFILNIMIGPNKNDLQTIYEKSLGGLENSVKTPGAIVKSSHAKYYRLSPHLRAII